MRVYREHQMVELVRDVAAGVPAGTRGCVVGVYGNGGYEVEVEGVDDAGVATAVLTVTGDDIRAVD